MTATILPFRSRAEYDEHRFNIDRDEVKQLTDAEFKQRIVEVMFESTSRLISTFKATGCWNPDANKHMSNAVDDLSKVCDALAGVKKNGKTT